MIPDGRVDCLQGEEVVMKPRIAIFDPALNVLRLFQAVLTREGYAVYAFGEELTNVGQLERIRPSLIILGYFKGYSHAEAEVILRLRARPGTYHVPILVCTTGAMELPDEASAAQVSIFPKPFHVADMLAAVTHMLKSTVGV
jgi:CheY-like chemotaxis protein